MKKEFFVSNGNTDYVASRITALEMIDKWLDEGEVYGTDHCIGLEYDPEEYLNLIFIREYLKGE